MGTLIIAPLPGVGFARRLWCLLRGLVSRRALFALVGVPCVQIEGQAFAVRPVPLGVARDMVPALLRCSQHFAQWDISEALYDDLVTVLALGLGARRADVAGLAVPLWELGPVVELIAKVNGMPVVEAGNLGELLALTKSTGTRSSPASSVPPAGPSSTSPAA